MKSIIRTLTVTVATIVLLSGAAAFGEDTATQSVTMEVNTIAVVDVTGNPATLTITAPGAGGADPVDASDNSTFVQYTSTVPNGQTRRITAEVEVADTPPAGTILTLQAAPAGGEGTGAGETGNLTDTAQDIITGIASVATGTGGSDGAQLTYRLKVDDVTALEAGDSETVTVTLTLTEAAGS